MVYLRVPLGQSQCYHQAQSIVLCTKPVLTHCKCFGHSLLGIGYLMTPHKSENSSIELGVYFSTHVIPGLLTPLGVMAPFQEKIHETELSEQVV